jgi:hypothetical protein
MESFMWHTKHYVINTSSDSVFFRFPARDAVWYAKGRGFTRQYRMVSFYYIQLVDIVQRVYWKYEKNDITLTFCTDILFMQNITHCDAFLFVSMGIPIKYCQLIPFVHVGVYGVCFICLDILNTNIIHCYTLSCIKHHVYCHIYADNYTIIVYVSQRVSIM